MNGVFYNMSNEDYHRAEGISRSDIAAFARGFEHYEHSRVPFLNEETDAMKMGTALHMAVLEPDKFDSGVVSFDGRRAGKEWIAFSEQNSDKLILPLKDYDEVLHMRDSVLSHPFAKQIILPCKAEVSIFWEDAETGYTLKSRLDGVLLGSPGLVLDIKTTAEGGADEGKFRRTVEFEDYGYDMQVSMCLDACAQFPEEFGEIRDFIWIVVEKKEPYRCEFFYADPIYRQIGRQKRNKVLKEMQKYFEDSDRYRAEQKVVKSISPTRWYEEQIEVSDGV